MRITATIRNTPEGHSAAVATDGNEREITIPAKSEGRGSAMNGGELLFLALATSYGDDVYREAKAAGLAVDAVEVHVEGEFGVPGDPATGVTYRAVVTSAESPQLIEELLRHTDEVAEIQNTLRVGTPVRLESVEVRPPSA